MAGDGQRELAGTIINSETPKIFTLEDGRVFGGCGDMAFARAVVDWLDGKGEKPNEKPDGFAALVLAADGRVEIMDFHLNAMPAVVPVAVGSGMDLAIGAMERGATSEEAVEIAARRDPSTGGKITVLKPR
jgi:20S proteasome alpha/beta subunit